MSAQTIAPMPPCIGKTWEKALRDLFKAVSAVRDAHISTDTQKR